MRWLDGGWDTRPTLVKEYKDTMGHTSTPVFSVDCCLLCIFPCRANWLQISTVSIQFDLGLPSLLVHESICQRAACFSILDEMVPKNCSCTPFVDFCLLPPIVTFDRELSHTDNVICHRSTRGLFQSLQRYELSDSNIGYSIKLVGLRINWNLVSFLVLASQLAIIITVIIAVMFIKCWNN